MIEPSISVIIPAYNSMKTLTSTLTHLNRQASLLREIIVVDSSPPETQNELATFAAQYPVVKTVLLDKKTMPAIARNIGAAKAEGSLLVFIDSDAYPDDKWIETIIDGYKSGYRVGGGSIELPEFQRRNLLAVAQYFLQFNEYMSVGEKRRKKFVPSCNLFCDRALFESLGGFPEVRASEDVLFGLAASRDNELWFLPESKVFHIFGDSWQRFKNNQFLLGKYVAAYRKEGLKNSLRRHLFSPAVQLPAFPLLPAWKYMLLLRRMLGADFDHAAMFSFASPAVFLGLIIWSTGFVKGATAGEDTLKIQ